jgi:hypothetical protein
MSVVDLHPEDLLDKDARGELTGDERVRLDTHVARCAACRAETMLRADFAAELEGDDHAAEIMGLVQGVLAAPRPVATETAIAPIAPTAPSAGTRTVETARTRTVETAPTLEAGASRKEMPELEAVAGLRRRPRRTAAFLLVAAAVLAAGAAGATGVTGRVWQSLRGVSLETTHASTTTTPKDGSRALGAPGSNAAAMAAPSVTSMPDANEPGEASDTSPATDEAATAIHAPPVALTAVAAPVPSPVTTHAVAPASATTTTSAATTASATTASGIFDAANRARRDGDTVTALARYDALERQFPGTPEARVAKATTGKLLLDRGDAAGALARFDAYLASGSTELREETMAGRATALEHLGRDDEEVRAWAALLAAYPSTPYASHARSRVGRSLPR